MDKKKAKKFRRRVISTRKNTRDTFDRDTFDRITPKNNLYTFFLVFGPEKGFSKNCDEDDKKKYTKKGPVM